MSKDKPEAGDVFESSFAEYSIVEDGSVWCECAVREKYSVVPYNIKFRSLPTFYLTERCKYLGKSKVNINDLFKTENEE